jgi:hypothetical protein
VAESGGRLTGSRSGATRWGLPVMDGLSQIVREAHSGQFSMAGWRTVHLEGEHTVVHGGEIGGNRLVRLWSKATTGSAMTT